VEKDVFVAILGTGNICFHTDDVKISMKDMLFTHREDFSIYKLANERNYRRVIFAHPEEWLKSAAGEGDTGLYGEAVLECSAKTELVNVYRTRGHNSGPAAVRKKVLFIADRPDWAWAFKSRAISGCLDHRFEAEVIYERDRTGRANDIGSFAF